MYLSLRKFLLFQIWLNFKVLMGQSHLCYLSRIKHSSMKCKKKFLSTNGFISKLLGEAKVYK
jgi:hypothetical protein